MGWGGVAMDMLARERGKNPLINNDSKDIVDDHKIREFGTPWTIMSRLKRGDVGSAHMGQYHKLADPVLISNSHFDQKTTKKT